MAVAVSMFLRKEHSSTFRLKEEAGAPRAEVVARWLAPIFSGAGGTEWVGNLNRPEKQEPMGTWICPPTVDSSRSRNTIPAAPLTIYGSSTGIAPAFQHV